MADAKRILVLVGGLAVVGAGGWFAWQQFMNEPEPEPVVIAKPARPSPAAMEPLLNDLLAASGFAHQIEQLPSQIQAGFREGLKQRPLGGAAAQEVEKALAEAFSASKFQARVQGQLKKNFDQPKLQAMLAAVKTPAAQRMVELEKTPPVPADLIAFAKALQSNPLPAERQALLQRLEEATKASGLSTEIMLASLKAMAEGAAGDKPVDSAALDKVIESQRAAAAEPMRNAAIINFAYTYRKASNEDLADYVKIYETDHGKWFTGQLHTALVDEFRTASGSLGKRLGELARGGDGKSPATPVAAKASPAKQATAEAKPSAPPALASAAPAAPAAAAAPAPAKPVKTAKPSRRSEDARDCLGQEVNESVIKCAEAFR
jgi:hypothetical protein